MLAGAGKSRGFCCSWESLGSCSSSGSFPDPGGADEFHRMVEGEVGVDAIGIGATRDGGLGFSFPVVILSGVK